MPIVAIHVVIVVYLQAEIPPPCETVDLDDHREEVAFSANSSRKKLSGLQRKLGLYFSDVMNFTIIEIALVA